MARLSRAVCFLVVNLLYMCLLSLRAVAYVVDISRVRSSNLKGSENAIRATSAARTDTSNDDEVKNIILFDGVCNFCNTWVDVILQFDVDKKFKFASLQSNTGRELLGKIGKDRNDISSVILLRSINEHYSKSEAVLNVVKELRLGPVVSAALSAIFPLGFRDGVYDIVAENRYSILGKRSECRCSDPKFRDRFLL